MEKPIYPSRVMRITQGYNEGTHKNSFAIDDAGADTSKSLIYAPFTGIIKKIYQNDANEVWLESIDKVEYPNGDIDYMTILFAHADEVNDLFVGKQINQNEAFYSEGTKGQATGNHCHIECAKGKFTGSGWYKNASGNWSINNGQKPEDCLWINDDITILDNYNYNFKKIEVEVLEDNPPTKEPSIPNESESKPTNPATKEPPISNESESKSDSPKLIFTCPKNDLYGVYLKKGEQLFLK